MIGIKSVGCLIALSAIAIVLVSSSSFLAYGQNSGSHIPVMVPLINSTNPQYDLNVMEPYLESGDIVAFPINQYKYVKNLTNLIPGLQLVSGGTSVKNILPAISHLPSNVVYVSYDYENGTTPEWSTNQTVSIVYFDQLYNAAHSAGKKLVIVPVWVENRNFDWGIVAKHTDMLVVQVQNFQTGANVPPSLKPSKLGMNLTQVTNQIVSEVRTTSPSTKVYLEFGFSATNNPNNILTDINTVKGLGVDGVTIWYQTLSGNTTQVGLMQQLLSQLNSSPSSKATTTISSSANPSTFGNPVTFTATISPVAPATGTPSGNVTFTIDGKAQPAIMLNVGKASLTTTNLSLRTHSIIAQYSGNGNFTASTSPKLTQVVHQQQHQHQILQEIMWTRI
jgi:hypothetical protein